MSIAETPDGPVRIGGGRVWDGLGLALRRLLASFFRHHEPTSKTGQVNNVKYLARA